MNRVGMFAQGSGASIAILASAVDARIKVLDTLDAWGDWPTWVATSPFVPEDERAEFLKPEFIKKAAALETIDWMHRVQAKNFRFRDALFDLNTPRVAKEKLRGAVPPGTTVVIYKTPDEFNAVIRAGSDLEWIQHQLHSLPEPKAVVKNQPTTRTGDR